MMVNRSNLLRYLTPGIIVAMVLGFSFIIPATANGDKNDEQCGYGYGYAGHHDNESEQGEDHESQQAELNDEPCGEVDENQDEQGENEDNADTGDKTEQAAPKTSVKKTEKATAGSHPVTTTHTQTSGEKGETDEKSGGSD